MMAKPMVTEVCTSAGTIRRSPRGMPGAMDYESDTLAQVADILEPATEVLTSVWKSVRHSALSIGKPG